MVWRQLPGLWQLWPHVGPRRLPAAAADNRPGLGSETAAALEEEEEEEEGQDVKKKKEVKAGSCESQKTMLDEVKRGA